MVHHSRKYRKRPGQPACQHTSCAGASETVPHIKSGTVYLVNVPALLRKLDVESTAQDRAVVPLQDQERGALDG